MLAIISRMKAHVWVMPKRSRLIPLAFALVSASLLPACGNPTRTSDAFSETSQSLASPQSPALSWQPTWNTAPDKSRQPKDELAPTVGLAQDGFRGSPIFEDKVQKQKNAQIRDAFVGAFSNTPECAGITLTLQEPIGSNFALQVFSAISGRTGRLQWILYRMDTLGESAHGEGTLADDNVGLTEITKSVCSSIRSQATPKGGTVVRAQPSHSN